MPITLDTPLSLYSIVAAYIIAFIPHNQKYRLINGTIGFDNVNPRDTDKETLIKRGMSAELAAKAERMTGAHRNGNEVFPLWAAAVLVGNQAGIEQSKLNILSLVFVASRLVFNYIYINQTTKRVALLRCSFVSYNHISKQTRRVVNQYVYQILMAVVKIMKHFRSLGDRIEARREILTQYCEA
ncbi:hypothetical protein Clacol_009492 [Clathrus columnatus]|uniref:Uncharacterized protein n=1 Tax=Clathrus columnatus TaxID=1419009 RepID=A0AAV5AS94_9AGAM|nr:hypothetical protein Clacol_009492 [Clathrus columnatus]